MNDDFSDVPKTFFSEYPYRFEDLEDYADEDKEKQKLEELEADIYPFFDKNSILNIKKGVWKK